MFGLAAVVAVGLLGIARTAQSDAQTESFARATQQAVAEAEADARATQQTIAEAESMRAEAEAKQALSRELAAAALRSLETDAQLGLLLALQAVAVGPGGDQSVLPEVQGALHRAVWSSASRLLKAFPVPDRRLRLIAFDPSGDRLMAYSSSTSPTGETAWQPDGETRILDASGGRLLVSLPGFPASDSWRDIDQLATVDDAADNMLRLTTWDTRTGEPLSLQQFELAIRPEPGVNTPGFEWAPADIVSVRLSPDSRRLSLVVSPVNFVVHVVWDVTLGTELFRYQRTTSDPIVARLSLVTAVSFSEDSKLMAVGTAGGTVTVWHLDDWSEMFTDVGPTGTVREVEFDPGGRLVAAGLACGRIGSRRTGACPSPNNPSAHLWDIQSGVEFVGRINSSVETLSIAFSPNGEVFATGSVDGAARVWEVETGVQRFAFPGHHGPVTHLAFSPEGSRLATVSTDGLIRIWDLRPDAGLELLQFGESSFAPLQAQPALTLVRPTNYLAISGVNGGVDLWDAISGDHLLSLPARGSPVVAFDYGAEATHGATLDRGGVLRIWSLPDGVEEVAFPGFGGCCLAISPDAGQLAVSINPRTVGVFDLPGLVSGEPRDRAQLFAIGFKDIDATNVAYSPDGSLVAALGELRGPRIYRSSDGRRVELTSPIPRTYLAIEFSWSGEWFALAGSDGDASIYDVQTGDLLLTLEGHSGPVNKLAFSLDDTRLASASRDGTVKIWDATTGEELLTLFVATAGATDVAFSADGKRLYAAGADGVTRVYLLDLAELIELAESRVTRSLTTDECQRYLHVPECPTDS